MTLRRGRLRRRWGLRRGRVLRRRRAVRRGGGGAGRRGGGGGGGSGGGVRGDGWLRRWRGGRGGVRGGWVLGGKGGFFFRGTCGRGNVPNGVAGGGRGGPPPPPRPPPGPPPPPPIDLKFFGTTTGADGKRDAFLLHGDDVFLASDGEIVQRKYKVISDSANCILVEDMASNNRQKLPLLAR